MPRLTALRSVDGSAARVREFRDQDGGGELAHAKHALQQLGHMCLVLLDVTRHFGLDLIELAANRREQGFDAGSCHGACQPQPVGLGQLHRYRLAAPCHWGDQILLVGFAKQADEPLAVGPAHRTKVNLARVAASIRSVFARICIARAKSRALRGLTAAHPRPGRLQVARQRRLVAASGFHQ